MTEKQQLPPIFSKMVDKNGLVTPEWHRWFQKLKNIDDTIKKRPYRTVTGTTTLTTRDLGKTIYFNIGSSNADCVLPSVGEDDIGSWVTIMRSGTARLTIIAVDSDLIEYSSVPGRIYCEELKRKAANITLQLLSETQWAIIGSTGLWYVGA